MDALVQKKMENSLLFEQCSFYRNSGMFTNAIKLFPAFNPVDDTGTIRWTAGAAREISDRFSYTPQIYSVDVHLISMSHVHTLRSMLNSVATNFKVTGLYIYVKEMHINTVSDPNTVFSMDPLNLSAG